MKKKQPTAGERMIAGAESALAFARGDPDHGCIVHYPKKGRVFLSFEDICLRNLPEGKFSHRRITAEEARALVGRARQDNSLFCVSDNDLLAPYEEWSAEKNEDLCRVLAEHFGLPLSIRDFMSAMEHEGKGHYTKKRKLIVRFRTSLPVIKYSFQCLRVVRTRWRAGC